MVQTGARRHGFQCPTNVFQVLTWLLFSAFVGTFYALMVMVAPTDGRIAAGVLFGIAALATGISGLLATGTDPADPSIFAPTPMDLRFALPPNMLYCRLCECLVKDTSKHCTTCRKCVDRFDHHCIYLSNCVGRHNYPAFFSLLVSAAAMLTIQTAMCIYDIVTYAAYRADFDRRVSDIYPTMPSVNYFAACVVILALALIAWPLVLQLLLFHSYLVYADLTTYDYVSIKTQERLRQAMARRQVHSGPSIVDIDGHRTGHADSYDAEAAAGASAAPAVVVHGTSASAEGGPPSRAAYDGGDSDGDAALAAVKALAAAPPPTHAPVVAAPHPAHHSSVGASSHFVDAAEPQVGGGATKAIAAAVAPHGHLPGGVLGRDDGACGPMGHTTDPSRLHHPPRDGSAASAAGAGAAASSGFDTGRTPPMVGKGSIAAVLKRLGHVEAAPGGGASEAAAALAGGASAAAHSAPADGAGVGMPPAAAAASSAGSAGVSPVGLGGSPSLRGGHDAASIASVAPSQAGPAGAASSSAGTDPWASHTAGAGQSAGTPEPQSAPHAPPEEATPSLSTTAMSTQADAAGVADGSASRGHTSASAAGVVLAVGTPDGSAGGDGTTASATAPADWGRGRTLSGAADATAGGGESGGGEGDEDEDAKYDRFNARSGSRQSSRAARTAAAARGAGTDGDGGGGGGSKGSDSGE